MPSNNPLLLETVRIEDGHVCNLSYHQQRVDKSRVSLLNLNTPLVLQKHITDIPPKGCYRCRILYSEQITSITYTPYVPKPIQSLKIVSSSLSYTYKYADRTALNSLKAAHTDVDDIIIAKEGLLTDTTIANLAFFDGKKWITPDQPLLEGTMRAKLLEEGLLVPKTIRAHDIHNFSHVALINAMIGFKLLNPVTIIQERLP